MTLEFDVFIEAFERECEQDQIEWLCLVGAEAYEVVQQSKQFQNQTGNLFSSIGWAVVKDGRILREGGFKKVLNGEAGRQRGKALVREVMGKRGIQLIFVAGEHYATHVESKGFDVNTAGELIIDELMKQWTE